MNKAFLSLIAGTVMVFSVSSASAQMFGDILKSAGSAAAQTAMASLSPQAKKVVDQANKLEPGTAQENFLVTKAKELMTAKNYQTALELATYVITAVNSKSVDSKKIMADAKAALLKMAQDKAAQAVPASTQADAAAAKQVQADAAQTVSGLKGLFGQTK